MRSLFSFPLPCTTTLAATVPLQPEMSHRPHPAPVRRSPALLSAASPLPGPALTGPRPTVTRSQGARHAAPPSLPRAAARSHRAPSPEYRPAAARTHWARLVRIATTACRHPHPPMSPPSRSRAHRPPITTIVRRHPHRAHRAPPPSYTCCASPSASRPPRADIRVTPPSLSSRCGGPKALTGKNRTVCIPFSPNARKRPSSWQHPPEMHAFRDQDGNIFALCIHFRAQSGDSGYMACESCRQGPTFASRNPKSRMARRCCRRRAAFPRQRPAVRPNGLCAMRQRHATRGMAERALRPAARAWPACRMRAPAISLVPAAARVHRAVLCASRFAARIAPTHAAIRRAAHCGRDELSIGLFLPPSCCPRRRIAPIDARSPAPTEPQPRANRTPAPSQPGLVHPWSRLLPPAPRHSPRLALPRGSRCGSGNSREMVR